MSEGDTSSVIFCRLYLFLEKPSQFQVKLVKDSVEEGDDIEQEGGKDEHASVCLTDLSGLLSLKR